VNQGQLEVAVVEEVEVLAQPIESQFRVIILLRIL
jgi:hypothetical protein